MTKDELIQQLTKFDIPFNTWGQGNAKTLDHLLKELNTGECTVEENPDYGLLRKVKIVTMNVYYNDGAQKLKLHEDRQVYKNGRTTHREPETSLMEKLKPDENPFEGAKRALAEELDITSSLDIKDLGMKVENVQGLSYPGLRHEGTLFQYEVELSELEYNPEGYQEIQEDKTNYYVWRPL
jgi:hypothetical protein